METTSARREPRNPPRTSPAVHFLRPVFLAVAGLLGYGAYRHDLRLVAAAAALTFLSALPAVALHTSYRRRQEQQDDVRCG
jgi:hypothetical protein